MRIYYLSGISLWIFLLLVNISYAQTTIIGGDVSGEWTKTNSPYYIDGEIIIQEGEKLSIEPGVNIKFKDNYKLTVVGCLDAQGTASDSIIFTANDDNDNGWGGIRFLETPNTNDSSKIKYCVFKNGVKEGSGDEANGGAIFIKSFSKLTIQNSIFINNTARSGGAIYCTDSANIVLANNLFKNNYAAYQGGAIWSGSSRIEITGNIITRNTYYGSLSSFYGAGLFFDRCKALLTKNIIINNIGRSYGGAIYVSNYSEIKIINNTIAGNRANNGDALYVRNNSMVDVSNSILYSDGYGEIYTDYSTNVTQNHCITEDPKFVDLENDDINLTWANFPERDDTKSPCIDSGDPLSPKDPDSSRNDVGAIYFHQTSQAYPDANFTQNTIEGLVSLMVRFTDLSTQAEGNIVSWQWDFGDGSSSDEQNPIHTYTGEGVHDVQVIVTNQDGKKDTIIKKELITAIGGTKIIEGEVQGVWTKNNSPYNIYGDITIPNAETLSIEPGVMVRFFGHYKINIEGRIIAIGNTNDTIRFTRFRKGDEWHSIRFEGTAESNDSSIFEFCKIEYVKYNTGTGVYDGGGNAFYINGFDKVRISKSKLCNNYGGRGAGVFCINSNIVISDNLICNNSCNQYGGGICVEGCSPLIENNKILDNYASNGGGIKITNSYSMIRGNLIQDNSCYWNGAGISCTTSDLMLVNNVISNNISNHDDGGGIALYNSNPYLLNNTICFNRAEEGEGLYISGTSTPVIVNTIIYSNRGRYSDHNDGNEIYLASSGSVPNFSNCILQSGIEGIEVYSGSYSGTYENVFVNPPFFADTINYDFSLTELSPAINMGKADTFYILPTFDLNENPRVFDGKIDIGAYEYQNTIENRAPLFLSFPDDIELSLTDTAKINITFTDSDLSNEHAISVVSSNPNVKYIDLIEESNGFNFSLVSGNEWKGTVKFTVTVTDNSGQDNSSVSRIFNVDVNNFVNGIISSNTIWEDTVFINGNLTINNDALVTINPGTKIFIENDLIFKVYGDIIAQGTVDEPVLFSKKQLSGWKGIDFSKNQNYTNGVDSTVFKYCIFTGLTHRLYASSNSNITFLNCTFKENTVTSSLIEGVYAEKLNIILSIFENNNSTNTYNGLISFNQSNFDFINNLLYNNKIRAPYTSYSLIYVRSEGNFINNTIVNNDIDAGSVIYLYDNTQQIINNIFYYNKDSDGQELYVSTYASPSIKNNIINGAEDISFRYPELNFDIDPLFVDTVNHNYQVQASSIAINMGSTDASIGQVYDVDLEGDSRTTNGKIDLGAYEFQGTPQNRVPVLYGINDQHTRISETKTVLLKFDDFDGDENFNAEITTNTNAVSVGNIQIENNQLAFDLIPEADWSDTANVEVILKDNDDSAGLTNSIDFKLIVANSMQVCGTLSGDIEWALDTIYIACNTIISPNSTLNIAAGTTVAFTGANRLLIQGSLLVIGAENDSIYFTRLYNGDYVSPGLERVEILNNPQDTCVLKYCKFELGQILDESQNSYYNQSQLYLRENSHVSILHSSFYNLNNRSYTAIYADRANLYVDNCSFYNNGHYDITNRGGAIYGYSATATIKNSIFLKNEAIQGGAIYLYRTDALIENCLIAKNRAKQDAGGIYNDYSDVNILNTTLANNTCVEKGGGLYFSYDYSTQTDQIINTIIYHNKAGAGSQINSMQNLKIINSAIENGLDSIQIETATIYDIAVNDYNPYFIDTVLNDFNLSDSSYCINSGLSDTTAFHLNLPEYDLAGNTRIYNNGEIDLGAYEFQGEPSNRTPMISGLEYAKSNINTPVNFTFTVTELDLDNVLDIEIITNEDDITAQLVNNSTTSSTNIYEYELIPSNDFSGTANIIVRVDDNSGEDNSLAVDSFVYEVAHIACGAITQNTTWKDHVLVECDVFVTDSVELTIEPGTEIKFLEPHKISVKGAILAQGTKEEPIIFTAEDTETGWGGIEFKTNYYYNEPFDTLTEIDRPDTSILRYCYFEYGNANGQDYDEWYGGAIYVGGYSKLFVDYCTFTNNYAKSLGGAIYIKSCSPQINNCKFINNDADYSGSAIYAESCGTLYFINNYIYHCNLGVSLKYSTTKLVNFTFKDNIKHVVADRSSIDFVNCIFWNQKSRGSQFRTLSFYDDKLTFINCNVQETENAFESNLDEFQYEMINVYDVDPIFEPYSYKLKSESPMLNIGDNSYDTINLYDIDGNPRIYSGKKAIVDIGAFEYQGESTNRRPIINDLVEERVMVSSKTEIPVVFTDPDEQDAHSISIASDVPEVEVQSLIGDTSGAVFTLVPAQDWMGTATISISVTDNSGEENATVTDTFQLVVSNEACGLVRGDATWDYPYIKVICDVVVDSSATLTIKPGTKVEFLGTNKIDVYGNIIAEGKANDSIVFTVPYAARESGWRGIRIYGAEDTTIFDYCIFEYCKANTSYPESKFGALAISDSKQLIVKNSRFSNNSGAGYGCGIQCISSQATIVNNLFNNNHLGTNGGAIYTNGSNIIIEKNVFEKNKSNGNYECVGGGIYSRNDSSVLINNNNFLYNESLEEGGAIGISGSKNGFIINNVLSYNKARSAGGAIHASNSNVNIIGNLISHNTSEKGSYYASGGGGIKLRRAQARIINTTIANNSDFGIYVYSSDVEFINTIFSGNSYNDTSNVYIYDGSDDPSAVSFSNSIIDGGANTITKLWTDWSESDTGLISCVYENPLFQDVEVNNFALDFNSPAINRGYIDTTGLNLPIVDLKDNQRIFADTIDIGAYEFQNSIENRVPKIQPIANYVYRQGDEILITVDFFDVDFENTHTISLISDNPEIGFEDLSGQIPGSTFKIVPNTLSVTNAKITVQVEDNSGEDNSLAETSFEVFFADTFDVSSYYIDKEFIWNTDLIRIYNDVIVNKDIALHIKKGTKIEFQGSYKLDIKGNLFAKGEKNDSITFTLKSGLSEINWNGVQFNFDIHNSIYPPEKISVIEHCIFEYASIGLKLIHLDDIKVNNSCFRNNQQAIYVQGGATIEDSDIYNNNSSTDGAGIFANGYSSIVHIYNNRIHDNFTTNKGGAIYVGGGVIVMGNLIYNNSAQEGGGLYIYSSRNIINNTITKNRAQIGGGAYVNNEQTVLVNNIFQYNKAVIKGDEIYFYWYGYRAFLTNCYIENGLDSSVVDSGQTFEGIAENIFTENSDFVDTLHNDFSLVSSSICVNSGLLDTALMFSSDPSAIEKLTIEGAIDIGAVEFLGIPDNRLPMITLNEKLLQIRTDKVSSINIPFKEYDAYDHNSSTVETDNNNIKIKNVRIENQIVTFDIEPLNNWRGHASVVVKVLDASNEIGYQNRDTLDFYVSNTHNYCGVIKDNTTWDADTININCNVIIDKDAKLTISPGTIIDVQGGYYILVKGQLDAGGTKDNFIRFTSTKYKWSGLKLERPDEFSSLKKDSSFLSYCIIENTDATLNYETEAALTIERSEVIVENSKIWNNSYTGIKTWYSSPAILNSEISHNRAPSTGGIVIDGGGPLIIGCLISHNEMTVNISADNNGGGIRCEHGSPKIINNIISYNIGGGIDCGEASNEINPKIINNIIHSNVTNSRNGGSGILCEGCKEETVINNNLIYNNQSVEYGGGIFLQWSRGVKVNNNTIVNNQARKDGGGIFLYDEDHSELNNNIIWGNTVENVTNNIGKERMFYDLEISNSLIEGGMDSLILWLQYLDRMNVKNIYSFNPDFIDSNNNDFRLSSASQCIDVGLEDTTGLSLPLFDLAGNARIVDIIDIGAYETRKTQCVGGNSNIEKFMCLGDSINIGDDVILNPGQYSIIIIDENGCDSTVNLDLKYYDSPILELGNDTTINDGILLDAGIGFTSYQWNNNEVTQAIIVDTNLGIGRHEFSVVVQDENGCFNSDTINITIDSNVGDDPQTISSVINIYPNPTKDLLTIESSERFLAIEMRDAYGKLLYQKKDCETKEVLDLNYYSNGIYTISFISEDGILITQKIVKY